jgi:hypothetical protein
MAVEPERAELPLVGKSRSLEGRETVGQTRAVEKS